VAAGPTPGLSSLAPDGYAGAVSRRWGPFQKAQRELCYLGLGVETMTNRREVTHRSATHHFSVFLVLAVCAEALAGQLQLTLLATPLFAQGLPALPSAPCPVTVPNGGTPPGERPDPSYHGNGDLWTVLSWPEGKIVFRPGGSGFVLPDGSLSMKWGWWRGVRGKLTIEGRRLDGHAGALRARIPAGYGDIGFQATALIFPTEGCWEVTGKVGGATLTFVTLVVRVR
jgi:hypothetical protein